MNRSKTTRNLEDIKRVMTNRNWIGWTQVAASCADIAMSLRDRPRVLDYVLTGVRLISTILGDGKDDDDSISSVFDGDEWEYFGMYGIQYAVYDLLRNAPGSTVFKAKGTTTAKVLEIDGVSFGWVEYEGMRQHYEGPYIQSNSMEAANLVLHRLFWDYIGSDHALLTKIGSIATGVNTVFVTDEFDLKGCLDSKQMKLMAERVSKFSDADRPWSVLTVGPPGTGKSTLIRQIASTLDKRTLRIPVYDIMSSDPDAIVKFVEVFKPEVLILDDLDRVLNPINLLDGLERYRRHTGIVLASMNTTKTCNPALLRPGRFDEIVPVEYCDPGVVQQFVPKGDGNYKTIKKWPIAYIRAYCDVRDILGQAEADAAVEDLDKRQAAARLAGQHKNDDDCDEDDDWDNGTKDGLDEDLMMETLEKHVRKNKKSRKRRKRRRRKAA